MHVHSMVNSPPPKMEFLLWRVSVQFNQACQPSVLAQGSASLHIHKKGPQPYLFPPFPQSEVPKHPYNTLKWVPTHIGLNMEHSAHGHAYNGTSEWKL